MLGRIFLGPSRFWALWIAVLAALYAAGRDQLHVRHYSWFLALLGVLAVLAVFGVVFTTRRNEQVTREPIEEEEPPFPTDRDG